MIFFHSAIHFVFLLLPSIPFLLPPSLLSSQLSFRGDVNTSFAFSMPGTIHPSKLSMRPSYRRPFFCHVCFFKRIVHHDQRGSIQGRQGWFNIHTSISGRPFLNQKFPKMLSRVLFFLLPLYPIKTDYEATVGGTVVCLPTRLCPPWGQGLYR